MGNKKISLKSKLLKLKEWLTLPEAAKHLSNMLEEEVEESDVLRLALDGHLKLSVNFVNHAYARKGDKFLPFEEWVKKMKKEATWQNAKIFAGKDDMVIVNFPGFDMTFGLKDEELNKDDKGLRLGADDDLKNAFLKKMPPEVQSAFLSSFIELSIKDHRKESEKFGGNVPPSTDSFRGKVISIDGVWDLPMLGNERFDVEHKFQMMTEGPEVTLGGLDGAFIEGEDGAIYQLQERFPNNDSSRNCDKLNDFEKKIVANGNITEERLLEKKKERANRPFYHPANFYPAGGIPQDSVLVIRTRESTNLLGRLSQADSDKNTHLDSRAETTYLNIIGAMLETFVHKNYGKVDFPSEAKLREFLSEKYAGFKGLTERTLAEKFAAAKRTLDNDLD